MDLDKQRLQNEDREKDMELTYLVDELIRIVDPDDPETPCIPFCMIRPVFSARQTHDSLYRVTAQFRKVSGSAAMRTRLIGTLLCASGLGDQQEQMLWREFKTMPELNADLEDNDFKPDLEGMESRYSELEEKYDEYHENIDEHDRYEKEDRFKFYNFAFYEKWTQDPENENGIVRKWVLLGENVFSFMYDPNRPFYKIVECVIKHGGFTQEGLKDYMEAMNQEDAPGLMEDPGLKFYERLRMT